MLLARRAGAGWLVALLLAAALVGCDDAPTRPPQLNPLPGATLSSEFGPRPLDPVTRRIQADAHHDGYDLAAAEGTPIRAAKTGRVVYAGWRGGYGNCVEMTHEAGWSTLYGHARRLSVRAGQWVKAGQVIGYVGRTGRSTGPHLHYELRLDGRPVDPLLEAVRARQQGSVGRKSVVRSGKLKLERARRSR